MEWKNERKMEWENLWMWVRNVTPLGGWCAPRWLCVDRHLRASQSLKIRPQTCEDISLAKSLHNLCRVYLLHSSSTCKIQWVGLLFIGEGALENKQEG